MIAPVKTLRAAIRLMAAGDADVAPGPGRLGRLRLGQPG